MVVRALRRASASRKRIRGLFFFFWVRGSPRPARSPRSPPSVQACTSPPQRRKRPCGDPWQIIFRCPSSGNRLPPTGWRTANGSGPAAAAAKSSRGSGTGRLDPGLFSTTSPLRTSRARPTPCLMLVYSHPPTHPGVRGFASKNSQSGILSFRKVFESTRLQLGGKTSESARAPNAPARQEPDLSKPVPLATGPAEDDNGGRNCGSRRRDQR